MTENVAICEKESLLMDEKLEFKGFLSGLLGVESKNLQTGADLVCVYMTRERFALPALVNSLTLLGANIGINELFAFAGNFPDASAFLSMDGEDVSVDGTNDEKIFPFLNRFDPTLTAIGREGILPRGTFIIGRMP